MSLPLEMVLPALPINLPGADMPVDPAIWSILLGVCLSAACGFRVFIPPLILSIGANYLHIPLPEAMQFLATDTAFLALLAASLVEMGAYYVPWLDNFLDSIATPLAMIAGIMMTGLFMSPDTDPVVRWTIAVIAGGGMAGLVQSTTNVSRLTSSIATLGLANPILATIENVAAVLLSIFAIFIPVVAIVTLVAVVGLVAWLIIRFKKSRAASPLATDTSLE